MIWASLSEFCGCWLGVSVSRCLIDLSSSRLVRAVFVRGMVFKCIASVRTETIDSDARRSLEDALRSVTGDGLPSRCPEPTDDAPPQQPPRPSHSTKNMRFSRNAISLTLSESVL